MARQQQLWLLKLQAGMRLLLSEQRGSKPCMIDSDAHAFCGLRVLQAAGYSNSWHDWQQLTVMGQKGGLGGACNLQRQNLFHHHHQRRLKQQQQHHECMAKLSGLKLQHSSRWKYFQSHQHSSLSTSCSPGHLTTLSMECSRDHPSMSLEPIRRPFSSTSHADIKEISEILRIVSLAKAFRERGHYVATLDPLGRSHGVLLDNTARSTAEDDDHDDVSTVDGYRAANSALPEGPLLPEHARDLSLLLRNYPLLDLTAVGMAGIDPNKRYYLGDLLKVVRAQQLYWTVQEVVALLRAAYCGTMAVEYSHIRSKEQKLWIQQAVERPPEHSLYSPGQKRRILEQLLYADHFERFLGRKFPSSKRFGIEGAESLIPGLLALMQRAADHGVTSIELGMAHRGRLNVLHSVLGKPLGSILSEFQTAAGSNARHLLHAGDVKYHLGTRCSLQFGSRELLVSLLPNPSHLEAVAAVVVGKVAAKQFFSHDRHCKKAMGLVLHGDAAFSGLGIAAEVLQLSDLPDYSTGGTIHIIINNQIGFTTDPRLARSTPHPSDIAKAVGAPIFHVNADDPEAVVHACQLAVDWRQLFQRDVVVDLVCYRRHGHNEQDDPRVTQPIMYQIIEAHATALQIYSKRLLEEETASRRELEHLSASVDSKFESEFNAAKATSPAADEWLAANWQGDALGSFSSKRRVDPTGMPLKTLDRVAEALCNVPPHLNLHENVKSLIANRRQMMKSGEGIDWAMAEALAFGSLLLPHDESLHQTFEGNPPRVVRLSGQDSERGTFNQRHAVVIDQETGERFTPLNHMCEGQQQFLVCNSSLSEAAVLGFEFGFSLESENALVLWEAQFGDFANNAQCMIDNFIASGEEKWNTTTNLVLLLPHGFDGQGPDHSSARLERFLQLCGDDPNHLPGLSPLHSAQIEEGFRAADLDGKGYLSPADLLRVLSAHREGAGSEEGAGREQVQLLLSELGLESAGQRISFQEWRAFMVRWMRRNAERDATANLCIVNITTPANYFHALRRQVNRPYSKPLVIMAPKYLLHHKAAVSSIQDFLSGNIFRRVIADGDAADNMKHSGAPNGGFLPNEQIRRLLICSGKVYYLLSHARRARNKRDIAMVRLEQLAPLAFDRIAAVVDRFPNAQLVWVQEEPKNMGAWSYVEPRLASALPNLCLNRPKDTYHLLYVGREASPTTATGNFHVHMAETKHLIDEALR